MRKAEWRNGLRPSSCHTNPLQKSYEVLATPDSLSFRSSPCGNWCSGSGHSSLIAERCKNVMKQFITVCVLMTEEIMSASTLSIRWTDCDRAQPVVPGGQNQYFGIRVKPRERYCPSCDSIVYSRRHRLCGVCGHVLPLECRFTAPEAESVETLLRIERQRHRAWLKRTTAM